jgi:hypothetical protein
MAKEFGSDVIDNGIDYPRARAAAGDTITLHVIKAYSAGDSYATILSNSIGSVPLSASDLVLANDSTVGRKVTVASKTISAASAGSGATPNLHYAIVNTTATSKLVVTDETTDQVVTSGNPLTTGSWAFKLPFAAT